MAESSPPPSPNGSSAPGVGGGKSGSPGGAGSSGGGGTGSGNGASGGANGGGGSTTSTGVEIFVAYADTFRASGKRLPTPWDGSPNVTFVGCGTQEITDPDAHTCATNAAGTAEYDSGAIRVDNDTSSPLRISNANVEIGTCTYNPWPGLNATIQPGNTLILTQTGGQSPCGDVNGPYNFDTSESHLAAGCKDDNLIPIITLSINGATTVLSDTNQVLNTGGSDGGDCSPSGSEFHDWEPIT